MVPSPDDVHRRTPARYISMAKLIADGITTSWTWSIADTDRIGATPMVRGPTIRAMYRRGSRHSRFRMNRAEPSESCRPAKMWLLGLGGSLVLALVNPTPTITQPSETVFTINILSVECVVRHLQKFKHTTRAFTLVPLCGPLNMTARRQSKL